MKVDFMGGEKRTCGCGDLRKENAGESVVLMGWVRNRRDHGGLVFLDLGDKSGSVQVTFNSDTAPDAHAKARELRDEFVVCISGRAELRPEGTVNRDMPTGEIEVLAEELKILNTSLTPPFELSGVNLPEEEIRLKYRYLDLRRGKMLHNMELRHKTSSALRDYLNREGFLEAETPFLTRSTPEGARDYLVPSRVNPGSFYALPQSPQLFKQMLMVSGFEKYFQMARCFRDEDLRADRQPEHTQVDIEMSFVEERDVQAVVEGMMAHAFGECLGEKIETPFRHISYASAMDSYGTDKPDLRFGLEIKDVSRTAAKSGFRVFRQAVDGGGAVRGLAVDDSERLGRRSVDALTEKARSMGAGGLAWFRVAGKGLESPSAKFLDAGAQEKIIEEMSANPGDLLLFVAGDKKTASSCLGKLRLEIASELGLAPGGSFCFAWIDEFPLFEFDGERNAVEAAHHPFCMPVEEDIGLMDSEPLRVRARTYDLVLNGEELGTGSIRIHLPELQRKVFSVLGMSQEEMEARFGFFLRALSYGAPPHGGIAVGLDRLLMLMAGEKSIRDVICFPKTQKALCLLTGSPADVDGKQLDELHIKLKDRGRDR